MIDPNVQHAYGAQTAVGYDAGLRAHMGRVYNRMTAGVLLTSVVAYLVSANASLMALFFGGPQAYILMLAPLAIVMFGFNPMRMSSNTLRISFFALCALYGISFATIFSVFTGESIVRTLLIATSMFAGLSIFGYTTKKNLDGLGTFAVMGMWGILILAVVNLFIGSSVMQNVIAAGGILVFSIMTAWNTQMTKEMYAASAGDEANSRMAWSAALNLYISFVALFQYLLQFLGNRE